MIKVLYTCLSDIVFNANKITHIDLYYHQVYRNPLLD